MVIGAKKWYWCNSEGDGPKYDIGDIVKPDYYRDVSSIKDLDYVVVSHEWLEDMWMYTIFALNTKHKIGAQLWESEINNGKKK